VGLQANNGTSSAQANLAAGQYVALDIGGMAAPDRVPMNR
jgi:hypothetical protein